MSQRLKFNPAMNKSLSVKTRIAHKGESGQSLVELAISIVVLLIILSGIVELSRAILTKTAMQDAAEEGVIYAMVAPKSCSQIQQRALDNLAKVKGVTLSSIIVTYNGATCSTSNGVAGDLIKVAISDSYSASTPFIGKFIGNLITIKVQAFGVVIKAN
jgi:Tfp pilus assembly protein PilV